MKFSYPGFNEQSLKMIYEEAQFHYTQYKVWLRDSVSVKTSVIAIDHMSSCETLVALMEKITRRSVGGGYNKLFPCSLEARLKSFQTALGIPD